MYLLDTNIAVFMFRGKFNLSQKMEDVGLANCFISEISIAELKCGALKSQRPIYQMQLVDTLINMIEVVSISSVIDLYAEERARLELLGTPVENFDLLIGVTAVKYGFTLITNNIRHFTRIENIHLEDWTLG
jgi:tRNA(fMet)-specific endonuclease VapC